MVFSSPLVLLKKCQIQDVFDYWLEDVSHMAHADQRPWCLQLLTYPTSDLTGCFCSLVKSCMLWSQTTIDSFGQTWAHIFLSSSWNFWRSFAFLPLSALSPRPAVYAWSLPESCLLLPASFQLTVDSIIEPQRGTYSHSRRSFRRNGDFSTS